MDDGTLGGEIELVLQNLSLIQGEFSAMGLELNLSKCEITVLGGPSQAAHQHALRRAGEVVPNITETPLCNLRLLGIALGPSGLREAVTSFVEKVKQICQRVGLLDSHWALFFLSRYVAAPRLNYQLRASPLFHELDALRAIDDVVRLALSERLNVDLSDEAWAQASLPVRHGGLGVRSVQDLALPCFIASSIASRPLAGEILRRSNLQPGRDYQTEAIDLFTEKYPDQAVPQGELARKQRTWDDLASSHRVEAMLGSANQVHRARLLAARTPHSGSWLSVTPVPCLGLHLDNPSCQVAVSLRLGTQLCQSHLCHCGQRVDPLGHHGLSCRYSAGRLPRHANLNDVVKRALAAAGIPSWLEPVGINRGDGKRPDGVTIFPFSQGKSLCWDSTCVDTFSQSVVADTAVDPGAAANRAEGRKREKYRGLVDRYIFEPVSVETSGVLGSSTLAFLRRVGKRITAQTGDKRETRWLLERISLAVMRGNAASVMATGRVDFYERQD